MFAGGGPATAASRSHARDAVPYAGHLLVLFGGGEVGAWDQKTGELAKDLADRRSRTGLRRLAADGEKLWAIDDATLFRWSVKDRAWEKAAGFVPLDNVFPDLALVPVSGVPFLVFRRGAIDPIGRKTFMIPNANGRYIPILAVHGTESMLWVGTAQGEWGGGLYGLNPKTGKWIERDSDLRTNVTGITHATKGEVIVSWLDPFGGTRIGVHGTDGGEKTKNPKFDDKVFYRVVYNPHDETLYGMESEDLVTIRDGKPTKVVTVKGQLPTADVAFVAPTVVAIVPLAAKTVAVVPKRGAPLLVRDGKVTRLRRP